jgi:hypothetical protein
MPKPTRAQRKIPHDVVQLRVTLVDVEPPIWRRVEIESDATFWDLHVAIQDAMGWKDCHLHVFHVPRPGGRATDEIGIPQDEFGGEADRITPGWNVPMAIYLNRAGDRAEYQYDFGDDWYPDVEIEARVPPEPGAAYPRCTDGARACPPEDCGGPGGYDELVAIMGDTRHARHREMKDWLGEVHGPFDPEAFAPATVRFTSAKRRLESLLRGQ